jgi:hypothetical protein
MMETKKAFRKLPNLEQAITALSNLKGVGTTMASGENFGIDDNCKSDITYFISRSDMKLSLMTVDVIYAVWLRLRGAASAGKQKKLGE